MSGTLDTDHSASIGNGTPCIVCYENHAAVSAPAVGKSTTLSCDHEAPIIVFHGSQDPISNRDHANAVNRNQGLENCIAISQYGDVAGSLTARHDSSPCADRGMNIIACNTKKQAMNCDDGVIGCLSATDYKEPQIICYENHAADSRVKCSGNIAPTLISRMGTGGATCLCCHGNETDIFNRGGQLQEAITMDNEVSKTLNCMHEAGRILSVFRSTEVSASRPSTSAASAKSSEQRRGITAP